MATVTNPQATRQFIDWHAPVLPATAQWLVTVHRDESQLDMSASVVVVPSASAGRRILELLLHLAEQDQLVFSPPHVTTVGEFPELLYQPQRPLASTMVQQLAWVSALQETPVEELRNFSSNIPEHQDTMGWLGLAKILIKWHWELGANALDFNDVLKAGKSISNFPEQPRWLTLAQIQRRYLDFLNQHQLWDRQTARLVAIRNREFETDRSIYLVGTVDLNITIRQIITQIAGQVTAIVFADSKCESEFDEFGCLNLETWQNRRLEIPNELIRVADQPSDQARIATEFLAELGGRYSQDEIIIGVPDKTLVSHLGRSMAEFGIEVHDDAGSAIDQSRPVTMLNLIGDWVEDERFESFAALVRHPDVFQWISEQTGSQTWISELDLYQNDRLPFFVPTDAKRAYFAGKDRHGNDKYRQLEQAHLHLAHLVESIVGPPQQLHLWAPSWQQILERVYQHVKLQRDRPEHQRMLQASQKLVRCLVEIGQAASYSVQPLSSIEALHWVLSLLHDEQVFDWHRADSISLVGWLDVPLDDAPVTVVTNVNDGLIPSAEKSNLFLPNSIRTKLGLIDNQHRYARDAYALSLVVHSRQRVLLICGRRDNEQQPIYPSRLLFGGDLTSMATRAQWLFGDGEVTTNWSLETSDWRPDRQQFVIPLPPEDLPPTNSMRVTDFKSYIQCPYRFYLSRVLNLQPTDDYADELDGAKFGSLVHDVLENFGRSSFKDSEDSDEIGQYLFDFLDTIALARYGRRPMPAVQIQLQQARIRLKAFATWQASHRREGWEIYEVERANSRYSFDLDGQPFEIRGQIDRVDVDWSGKRIGLYDYKSADSPKGPHEYHQQKNNWIDLQLPLYRWLLKGFDLPEDFDVQLGLILITKDTSKINLHGASWSDDELQAADRKAFEIMRAVRRNQFWPPAQSRLPPFLDYLAAICQSNVFERWEIPPDPMPGNSSAGLSNSGGQT